MSPGLDLAVVSGDPKPHTGNVRQFYSRTTDFSEHGTLTKWTHLKNSLEYVRQLRANSRAWTPWLDVLENCQEAFSFVRMQLTNFQKLVAGQIFEDLVQEFKVSLSLQNQFEENWVIFIALDLGQRNWSL